MWCSTTAPAAIRPTTSIPSHAMPNPTAIWQAEVTKTIKLYGAPIDAAVGKTVEYLAATY
jgi:hypothetical protein